MKKALQNREKQEYFPFHCDVTGETLVNIYEANGKVIAQLTGVVAKRFIKLMEFREQRQVSDPDYNCFGTALFLSGHAEELKSPERMPLLEDAKKEWDDEAYQTHLFQIVGTERRTSPGMKTERRIHGAVHAGILIEKNGTRIVLEKNGGLPPAVRSWNSVQHEYFGAEADKFRGAEIRMIPVRNAQDVSEGRMPEARLMD
jgi:hypothetical protein